ncbi:unnamed protein product [Pedinophyceae sp. YPF-701]|nr:unnamed protein product [Pedinophyceae sp. YPF-701]
MGNKHSIIPGDEPFDFATFKPTWMPHKYLVAPTSLCTNASPNQVADVYEGVSPSSLRDAWKSMIAKQPRTTEEKSFPDVEQYCFIQRSAKMEFPDDIIVQFFDAQRFSPDAPAGSSTLAVYSCSEMGVGDMGVNKHRVKTWLAALKDELGAGPVPAAA